VAKKLKTEVLKARVPMEIKQMITRLAEELQQPESVIVREAIREYLRRHEAEASGNSSRRGLVLSRSR